MSHPSTDTLMKYLREELSDSKELQTTYHLEKCDKCKKKFHVLEYIELLNSPKKELSVDFNDQILSKIEPISDSSKAVAAKIKSIHGEAFVFTEENKEPVKVFADMNIRQGDTVKIAEDSYVLLELNDGSNLWLNKDTEINFTTNEMPYNLFLKIGEILAMMKPQRENFIVRTPSAAIGVIGTDFDLKVEEEKTTLSVLKGNVSFKNHSGTAVLERNERVQAADNESPVLQKIYDVDNIISWCDPIIKRKKIGDLIMKKILIPLLIAIVVIAGGYFIYQQMFQEVDYTPTTTQQQTEPASTEPAPATSSQSVQTTQTAQVVKTGDNFFTKKIPTINAGDKYVINMDMDMMNDMKMPGGQANQSMKQDITMDQTYNISVLEKTSDGYVMELEYADAVIEINMNGMTMGYDTNREYTAEELKNPMTASFKPIFDAIVGTKLTYILAPDLEIKEVKGFEEMIAKVTEKTGPQMKQMLDGLTSKSIYDNIIKGFQNNFLTQDKFEIGSKWNYEEEMDMANMGKMSVKSEYEFKDWEIKDGKRYALLDLTGTIASNMAANTDQAQMSMKIKEGKMTGQCLYDPETGMVTNNRINQEMLMDMEMAMGDKQPAQKMEMNVVQDIIITATKVN